MRRKQNMTPPSIDNRFSGFDLDVIFKPIREFLRVDTPNVPTKTSFIVLPTIQEKAQQPELRLIMKFLISKFLLVLE